MSDAGSPLERRLTPPRMDRWLTNLSIEKKLPLMTGGLLLMLTAALAGAAYYEVRRSAFAVAGERLQNVTRQLTELFRQSVGQIKGRVHATAAKDDLRRYLATRTGREQALEALRYTGPQPEQILAVQLRSADGRILLATGAGAERVAKAFPGYALPPIAPNDSGAIDNLRLLGDSVVYSSLAAVGDPGKPAGYVVAWRRLTTTPRAREQLAQLIGSGAALLLGNTANDVWTDMVGRVPGPPVSLSSLRTTATYQRGDSLGIRLASAGAIPGSPWVALVEFPVEGVLAPVRVVVRRMALIAALCGLIGVGIAWLLSRRLTTPLRELSEASAAIAVGDETYKVNTARGDELGSLARAFEVMAAKVTESRHRLEDKIQDRTRALQVSERELERKVDALRAANSELEAFSYSVSHDLRAPLRHMSGFSELLEKHLGATLDDKARRYLNTIRGSADRMGRLIDDLLAFSRIGRTELRPQRVELDTLVAEAVREVQRDVNGRAVEWQVGKLPEVHGDAALLHQVFFNLLSNALKYTGPRNPARITIGAERQNGEVVVHVRDNGVGFDPRYADKLFGVFQRLHDASEFAGTGIGLANVQRIVTRHAGRVWAEGAVDQGATFYVALPANQEKA